MEKQVIRKSVKAFKYENLTYIKIYEVLGEKKNMERRTISRCMSIEQAEKEAELYRNIFKHYTSIWVMEEYVYFDNK